MRFSTSLFTTALLIAAPILVAAAPEPIPKAESVPAVPGKRMGPAGPESAKRDIVTVCDDPNYPINCANGYCCPYNTLCDGDKCDHVNTHGMGVSNFKAANELALALGVLGGVFAVL
ncbi:hypothetical protein F5884DRAFT_860361 [Xylogone sp. PMI_703]|nr:hypothetical protein F5884DRAFT_860361 [Xylogone sp. PMI_703]